jgi:hypothetical protein
VRETELLGQIEAANREWTWQQWQEGDGSGAANNLRCTY